MVAKAAQVSAQRMVGGEGHVQVVLVLHVAPHGLIAKADCLGEGLPARQMFMISQRGDEVDVTDIVFHLHGVRVDVVVPGQDDRSDVGDRADGIAGEVLVPQFIAVGQFDVAPMPKLKEPASRGRIVVSSSTVGTVAARW
ncbi:hypothetical protein AV521_31185 [Streptomyces sp. IMTB 2501]|nr:hypothetical protein AV521_31185 [Streptomyces sp. IMTB 2501]